MRILPIFLLAAFLTGSFVSCQPNHVKPYIPKRRDYRAEYEVVQEEPARTPGSLWSERDNMNRLFADPRASKVNDILVVKIEEISSANSAADTKTARDGELSAQMANFLGALELFAKKHPNFNKESLVSAAYKTDFAGGGETSRQGKIVATVPALIKKELSDGNLFIEGHRVVLVNEEEAHFYVSGIIRPHDIEKDNSISSSLIAEAQIEFTGRGVLTEKNSPGWGSRAMDYVWPF